MVYKRRIPLFIVILIVGLLFTAVFAIARCISLHNGMPQEINEKITAYAIDVDNLGESITVGLNIHRKFTAGQMKWYGTIDIEGASYEVQNIGHEKEYGFDIVGYVLIKGGTIVEEDLRIEIVNHSDGLMYQIYLYRNNELRVYYGSAENYDDAVIISNKIRSR